MRLVVPLAAALILGLWVARWWLLALPLVVVAAAAALLMLPGVSFDRDNPLFFLTVLLELALAAGISAGRYVRRRVAAN